MRLENVCVYMSVQECEHVSACMRVGVRGDVYVSVYEYMRV